MVTLREVLDNLKIDTHEKLEKYCNDNYVNQKNMPLKIVKARDLHLDNENRIFVNELIYEDTIFYLDELVLKNTKKIKLINCIFLGKLQIQNNEKLDLEIQMEYVLFKDSLKILNAENTSKIDLYDICTPELIMFRNKITSLSIYRSRIGSFVLNDSTINDLSITLNNFESLEISTNDIKIINFPHGQFNISNSLAIDNKKYRDKVIKNFSYVTSFNIKDYDNDETKYQQKSVNDTCKFLIKNSDYHINKKELVKLKYLENLSSFNNIFQKYIYIMFGGLMNPFIIIGWILGTILVYSSIFTFFEFMFCINDTKTTLTFIEAVYFSGISFATIGYGDISPIGGSRLIAVTEGLIGILLSSSFIVSLVRRYVD